MRQALAILAFLSSAWAAAQPPAPASPRIGAWGVDLGDQDRSVRPGDDFFRYQNGAWLARTTPTGQNPFKSYWGDVRHDTPARLIAILNDLAANPTLRPTDAVGKAATLYREYLDEAAIEHRGHGPLEPELAAIRGARNLSDIAGIMGQMEGPRRLRASNLNDAYGAGMFTMNVAQDRQAPDRYAFYLGQGGLLLPDPTYYSRPELADIKAAYRRYVERMLTLVGWPEPAARADEIVAFETEVAQASTPLEALQDPVGTYNSITYRRLLALAPGFDWAAYFRGAGIAPPARLIVDNPEAFARIAALYARAALPMLRARAAFAAADYDASLLGHDLYDAKVEFRTNSLFAASLAARERHAGGERLVEAIMPDTIGSIYIAHFSSPAIRAQAERMGAAMRSALDVRLQRADWLSPESRAQARRKLASMQIRVGFPTHLRDYRSLAIQGDGLYEDVHRAAAYQWREQIARLSQPFDREHWALSAAWPNYNYDPQANAAEVSAALFQPPFFDPNADDAVNFGAIGTIIAQQIMTGFDPIGIRYDANGRLADWLRPAERARMTARGQAVANHYSSLEPIPGVHPRGMALLGEAMSDIAGIEVALDAYHASLGGRTPPVRDGLTGDQRFFLGRAQNWRARFADEAIRNQLAQGSNAIPWMRVNGPLPNIDAWYAAFDVRPGDRLYIPPSERAHIW